MGRPSATPTAAKQRAGVARRGRPPRRPTPPPRQLRRPPTPTAGAGASHRTRPHRLMALRNLAPHRKRRYSRYCVRPRRRSLQRLASKAVPLRTPADYASVVEANFRCLHGRGMPGSGVACYALRPQTPMNANPQPRKSGSPGRAARRAASSAVMTPAEIMGSARAAMLSW